jgi:O-antigen/teichoic acid export membrane protein
MNRRTPDPRDAPEVVRARRPGGGWALAAGVLAGLLLILLLDRDGLPWLKRQLHERPLEEALSLLRWIFYSLALLFAALGAVIGRQAWRTFSSGRWPPPGAWVLVDTEVVHGLAARLRAAALGSASALLFAGAVGLSLFPHAIERSVTPQPPAQGAR